MSPSVRANHLMKKIRCLLVVLLAMSIQFARSADLPTVIDRPRAQDGPTQVSVGIWIADITSIDSAQQSFTAEIAVVLRWKDPRLAHTGNGVFVTQLNRFGIPGSLS